MSDYIDLYKSKDEEYDYSVPLNSVNDPTVVRRANAASNGAAKKLSSPSSSQWSNAYLVTNLKRQFKRSINAPWNYPNLCDLGKEASTGWPFRLWQTSHWHQNNSSVLVWGLCTKMQLLFWSQREVCHNLNGHPVGWGVSKLDSKCLKGEICTTVKLISPEVQRQIDASHLWHALNSEHCPAVCVGQTRSPF